MHVGSVLLMRIVGIMTFLLYLREIHRFVVLFHEFRSLVYLFHKKNMQRSFHRKTLPISNKVVLLKMNFDKLQNFCFYLVLTQFGGRNEKK